MELQHNVAYHTTMSSKTNQVQLGRKGPVYDEVIIGGIQRKAVCTLPEESEYEELT